MPDIKPAGFFWRAILDALGFAAIYTPWGIYIQPKWINNKGLRRHEITHWLQRQRDGFFAYWFFTFWYLIRYGYDNSPYEVEARRAQFGPDVIVGEAKYAD